MASFDAVEFEIDIGMQPKWAQTYDFGQQNGTVLIAADGQLWRKDHRWPHGLESMDFTGTAKIDVEDDSGEWRELFVTFEAGRMTHKAFAVKQ